MSVFTNSAASSPEEVRAYVGAILELLGSRNPMEVLQETPRALREALDRLPPAQVGQREAPGKWSTRHVLQHLADSDLVMGYRIRMVLTHDRPPLTGYDQDKWADRLRYDEADAEQAVRDFTVLREANLRLLKRATPEDLERVGVHSERGEESVEHIVRLYAGHDLLHRRQLERIRLAIAPAARRAGA